MRLVWKLPTYLGARSRLDDELPSRERTNFGSCLQLRSLERTNFGSRLQLRFLMHAKGSIRDICTHHQAGDKRLKARSQTERFSESSCSKQNNPYLLHMRVLVLEEVQPLPDS